MKKIVLSVLLLFQSVSAFASYPISAYINSTSGPNLYNTGVSVSSGQVLSITNSFYDTWTLGPNDRESNADGLGNPFGADYGEYSNGQQSFLYGSMVGRIDNNPYFLVGTNYTQVSQESGTLYLGCWDSNFEDNSGYIFSTIQTTFNAPLGTPLPLPLFTNSLLFLGSISLFRFRKKIC